MPKLQKQDPDGKPSKPHPDFPLFPHATRRWAKKIRGKLHYFGPWSDPEGSLERYLKQKDYLHAGRKPPTDGDGLTVRDLCNKFLTTKRHLADTGEITERTFADYHSTCARMVAVLGKPRLVSDLAAGDFEEVRVELAKTLGPVALGNEIQRVRMVFKYAFDQDLIKAPIKYGQAFRRPSKKVLKKERQRKGKRLFEPAQLRDLIDAAGPQLRAMILLGLNCGFGNSDCANLPPSALDLKRGVIDYPRPKTGVERRAPLWPETIQALEPLVSAREPDAEFVFVTKYGRPWKGKGSACPISAEFRKLLKAHRITRGSFYWLRHCFETIGGDSGDQVATSFVMGHSQDGMSATYREAVFDHRLHRVVNHVHAWLFGETSEPTGKPDLRVIRA